MVKKNACVFISGTGTNLKSLINNSRDYNFPINIKLIVSNKKKAKGLNFAKKFAIPFIIINTKNKLFEKKLLIEIKKRKISLICLAGYMQVLSKRFISNFKGKILNIHPSLLPKYKGTNTFKRILNNNETIAGCTVHFVNDKLDSGKIILKKKFNLSIDENEMSLKKKTQKLEYRAFSEAINKIYR
jgi:formyltetrahydrofolate-dependent phosphoribosylglycinamide formyltransferase|tara:strand:- start:298 stop:855 length:558 start_codon:yes stop_codon:yes gene_type:complete